MAIKTNLKSLAPRREQYKREIKLLSGGYSCPTAWPDGRLTVYPWDSDVDEWMYEHGRKTSEKELIFKVLEKVCDLNGASVDLFVADEVILVLLVARARLTADKVEYAAECPACGHKNKEVIMIPDELERLGEKPPGYVGYDDITLPVSQDVIRIRPLLVRDEREIAKRVEADPKKYRASTTRRLMRVVSVNGTKEDSYDELVTYFGALPPADIKFFDSEVMRLSPHLNTLLPHTCDKCGHHFDKNLDFNQEFFR